MARRPDPGLATACADQISCDSPWRGPMLQGAAGTLPPAIRRLAQSRRPQPQAGPEPAAPTRPISVCVAVAIERLMIRQSGMGRGHAGWDEARRLVRASVHNDADSERLIIRPVALVNASRISNSALRAGQLIGHLLLQARSLSPSRERACALAEGQALAVVLRRGPPCQPGTRHPTCCVCRCRGSTLDHARRR